ncbi:type 1 glutamine amidotransferase domain-containing protein [Parapedobacter tibetensis]|uniref:type 1 glutamine amidotransferase domain-containing protein n=1 Tax=Parapedobacter tibetensis TaxID=2972951 RepID=UPI00214D462B|nr:type 1 glutamine amidotransferase domain-containing protein [Parapedobacter tibetensis]
MKKVLMVLSSHAALQHTDERTGVWLCSFTDPYYTFFDEGFEVTLASPMGGPVPVDPMSEQTTHASLGTARFAADEDVRLAIGNTWKLDEVQASDFDALYYPDSHGAMWDLVDNERNARLLLGFLDAGKPVAMVGHSAAALIKVAAQRPEMLQGRHLTCFSNTEEALLKRHHHIPFALKDRLKELGAVYEKGIIPFTPHLVVEGLLITGQNASSSLPTVQAVVKALEGELV